MVDYVTLQSNVRVILSFHPFGDGNHSFLKAYLHLHIASQIASRMIMTHPGWIHVEYSPFAMPTP